jgi:GWxTD domain-containing protein
MKVLLAAALTALTGSAAPQSQDAQTLELQTARFYRAANSQTLFDGFFRVPFALLDAVSLGPRGVAAYRVTVSVRDSSGLELWTQNWSQTVPAAMLRVRGASALEHFAFATKPGRYTVQVSITDSATGRVTRQTVPAQAFDARPAASDLLLATGVREADSARAPRGAEVQKGAVVLQAAVRPVLTPQQAQLSYYLELYPERAESVTVAARVRSGQGGEGGGGAQLVATPGTRSAMPASGGATMAAVDLAGLPPGDYSFDVVVRRGTDSIVRSASFRMAGFETEAAIAEAGQPRDRFAGMTEAQLDTLYLPLVYLMAAEEQGMFPGLTPEGKRRWLRQFWEKRDPTPGTPRNETQEDFYTRIADANRRFREGGAAQIPGWRTDRGRIFIKYGAADEVLSRPQAGSTRPYEVWKYTRDRALKYVFLDQTLFGNYVLIWTNDRKEPSRPNWRELLGQEAVTEVERF